VSNNERPHYAVLMSGGLDSTVLAYKLLSDGGIIHPFFCSYHQKMEACESLAIVRILTNLGVLFPGQVEQMVVVNMGSIGRSRLTDKEHGGITKGEPFPYGNVHEAYVPCRDVLMVLHVASLIEENPKIKNIALGVHRTDHVNNFPDCNNVTWNAVEDLMRLSMARKDIQVHTPFMTWTKTEINEYIGEHAPYMVSFVFSGYGNALEY
jgi:7-cyano-7-deazaguanine synthase in queuosine biosynthesis